MNTAGRTSFGKKTAPKYDYHSGNGHFAYQTSFDFNDNQHSFKRDQYAETVGAGILKKYFEKKKKNFNKKNTKQFVKNPAPTVSAYCSLVTVCKPPSK